MADDWHTLAEPDEIPSPALLIYPERIGENIRRMIAALGQAERLRPHIKTHKMAELVQLQLKAGISKFKCATIAEAEMLAQAGAKDVLLANQPVGPNIDRLLSLVGWFRDVRFSTIADDAEAVGNLAQAAQAAGVTLPVWLDLDVGMGRTGIAPGQAAATLYKLIGQLPGVEPAGLHLYDGHLHEGDPAKRLAKWQTMMDQVRPFRTGLEADGLPVPGVVGGGTPTFPFHAQHTDHECSPGTTLLWDFGYRDAFPDLECSRASSANRAATASRSTSATRRSRRRTRIRACSSPASTMPNRSCTARSTSRSARRRRGDSMSATASTASRGTSARPSRCTTGRT